VHNDFKGEHLLVADDGGVVASSIGPTPSSVIRPRTSRASPSAGAVRAAELARYEGPVAARALALSRFDTLIRLADRLHGDDDSPLPLLPNQLALAWQRTPFDEPDAHT
jgi:hypothetical protein